MFSEPERPANVHIAHVDGASRGNPGPASYAVVLYGPDGKTKFQVGKYLGRATNNVAEYYGLITALDYALSQGIDRLLVRSDSELMVRQMQGRYKVNSADLKPLHERARKLSRGLAHFAIEHVRREQNREADELANIALDQTSSRMASLPSSTQPEQRQSPEPAPSQRADQSVRTVRARYSAGALHLLEALDLEEGEVVEVKVKRSAKTRT